MSKLFIAKRRREKDGKTFWDDVGFKVFQRQDGKMSLLDARTGEWYALFEPEQRSSDAEGQGRGSAPAPAPGPGEGFDDDIPF